MGWIHPKVDQARGDERAALPKSGEPVDARKRHAITLEREGRSGKACGRVFGLGETWLALPLRDSAGISPDFPRLLAAGT
jgi:hypothetical protein